MSETYFTYRVVNMDDCKMRSNYGGEHLNAEDAKRECSQQHSNSEFVGSSYIEVIEHSSKVIEKITNDKWKTSQNDYDNAYIGDDA